MRIMIVGFHDKRNGSKPDRSRVLLAVAHGGLPKHCLSMAVFFS